MTLQNRWGLRLCQDGLSKKKIFLPPPHLLASHQLASSQPLPLPCTSILSLFRALRTGGSPQPEEPGGAGRWAGGRVRGGCSHHFFLCFCIPKNFLKLSVMVPSPRLPSSETHQGHKSKLNHGFFFLFFASMMFSEIKSLFRPGLNVSQTSPIPPFMDKL